MLIKSGRELLHLSSVYDATGRQILANELINNITEINTASLSKGSYMLKIENGNLITTQKVLIIHK